MKKIALLVSLASLLLAGIAQANPTGVVAHDTPSAGGMSSDNVEWVKNLVISQDAVGGRVVGKYFYANDQNKIMIFDLSDPLNPQLTDFYVLPQEWELSREDIDTNGKILIVPNLGTLYVFDVEDKSNIQLLATAPGGEHTQSCVLDCKWAYGSDGAIHDLRNPAKPKRMDVEWGADLPARGGHDVEEVRYGFVLTATQPIQYLDVRKDPVHPKLLALGANDDGRFIHSGRWPRNATDDFLLMGGETNLRARCGETNGAFMTWDARNWKKTHTFRMIDELRMENGTYVDGKPPANPGIGGCSSHWLEPSPRFRDGGIVAMAFFGHGSRFFDVSPKGKITEVGWFLPAAGETGAIYWVTDEILYAVDYNRGIDVLRFTGKQ